VSPVLKPRRGPPLAGPLLLAAIAWGILEVCDQARWPVPADYAPPSAHEFEPAAFVPLLADAFAEPSTHYRSFARLPPVHVHNLNTGESADILLYDLRGTLRPEALERLDQLLCDSTKPDEVRCAPMDRRTIQLMFRAAYHFGRGEVVLISGYRQARTRQEGLHAQGRAIDFKLTGVRPGDLANFVRGFPRAGIGVYTHPRTQYVHVDSRERSYQWADSSAPGAPGTEWPIASPEALLRLDRSYTPESDWPERTQPPPLPARHAIPNEEPSIAPSARD